MLLEGIIMQTYEIVPGKGVDGLVQVERPEPKAEPGRVVVRIRAASLNYRDLLIARGTYRAIPPGRLVPLSDGAGEVVSVGSGVTRFKAGDRVVAAFMQSWVSGPPRLEHGASALGGAIGGVLAEQVSFSAEGLVRIPDSLSFERAATLPCAGVTAWNALFESGRLSPGEWVLTQGTGGVSVFAIQLARAAGASVLSTSSSDAKLSRARELGATATVNYQSTPGWGDEAVRLTGGAGVDHVVEVGGAGTLGQSLAAVRAGGTVSIIGVLTGVGSEINVGAVLGKSARLQGIFVGSRQMLESLVRAVTERGIEPVVDRTFSFDRAPDAYRYLESGGHFGKVVITL
jgi:NADPH:quinone reductase-like Zn-dependent oxidoreductase